MTLNDLLLDEGLVVEGGEQTVRGLTLDSRKVEPGFVFAALPGVKVHGRDFIPKALTAGASVILTDEPVEAPVPVIAVPEPAALLARMAARFYPRQPEHIVAITGTNGKKLDRGIPAPDLGRCRYRGGLPRHARRDPRQFGRGDRLYDPGCRRLAGGAGPVGR